MPGLAFLVFTELLRKKEAQRLLAKHSNLIVLGLSTKSLNTHQLDMPSTVENTGINEFNSYLLDSRRVLELR